MENLLAYFAGIVDGEGTLVVGKQRRKENRNFAYRGYLQIANTHVPMLRQLQTVFGGKIYEQGPGKRCYSLTFSAHEIRQLLPQLIPHLIVKREQAIMLSEFLERQLQHVSAPLTDDLLAFYELCYQRMKQLKLQRFTYREPRRSLGFKRCMQCGLQFEVFSTQPRKMYCDRQCKKKTHWTRSNRRIALHMPAWSALPN